MTKPQTGPKRTPSSSVWIPRGPELAAARLIGSAPWPSEGGSRRAKRRGDKGGIFMDPSFWGSCFLVCLIGHRVHELFGVCSCFVLGLSAQCFSLPHGVFRDISYFLAWKCWFLSNNALKIITNGQTHEIHAILCLYQGSSWLAG